MSTPKSTTTTNNLPSILVVSDIDGRKFKMVLKGSLEKLSVTKIKNYLEQSTKVPVSDQILQFHGTTLENNFVGADFGLHPGAELHLNSLSMNTNNTDNNHSHNDHNVERNLDSGLQPVYHQSSSMEQGYSNHHHHQSASRRSENNNNNNTSEKSQKIADEIAAIRSSLDNEKKASNNNQQQQQQSYFSSPPPSHQQQENINPKSTVHSSVSESVIPESLLMASTKFSQQQRTSNNNTSSPYSSSSQNHHHQVGAGGQVPASSPLSEMQISASMIASENSQLKSELDKMKGKMQALEAALQAANSSSSMMNDSSSTANGGGHAPGGVLASARVQLHGLSNELGLDLTLDDNFSCVIGSDDSTVLLTVDPATERLYIYSTLLENLDKITDERKKSKVYRALLEWSMLGRDMAGGGCGIDSSTGVVIMSTSIDLKNSRPSALRDTAPVFVESLVRWRQALNTLINA